MRSVKYFGANSLDGFISRADGSVDWLFMDQDYGMSRFFASVDTAIMGRKTYDTMQQMSPGQTFFPGIKHYVLSRSQQPGQHGAFTFLSGDPVEWLAELRSRPGKDIWLVGGGELLREFLQHHLLDEIVLTIHPRLLGSGVPLFPEPYPETELELDHCDHFSTGLVQVFYRVKH
ncbi:dihydrofolate reductase family protein [Granulicella sibirica]|uniref:Dihydrofolate reductase n=1 Tax=Granulicella sibirica TaxID=2479048 RepID=A0A4Q0T5X4_9BACT|nr:dihydrofolate reductase family protein [Granulicella sibirica]RXH58817.1 Dihydrofolate reductase [Granulicella sibirica]